MGNVIDELELPPYEDEVEEESITEDQEEELLMLSADELLQQGTNNENNDHEALNGNPFMGFEQPPQSVHNAYLEALAEVRK
jgi:hypothetical protein